MQIYIAMEDYFVRNGQGLIGQQMNIYDAAARKLHASSTIVGWSDEPKGFTVEVEDDFELPAKHFLSLSPIEQIDENSWTQFAA